MPWIESKIQFPEITGARFQEAAVTLDDMTPVLSLIGENIVEGVAKNFETEGAYGDEPWAELTEQYRKWKTSKSPGVPKLVGLRKLGAGGYSVSGKMKAELISPASIHITPRTLSYLPLDDKVGFHQTGTPKMKARPPVRITERQLLSWDEYAGEWLDSVLAEAGA